MGVVLQRIIGMYGLGLTVEAPLPFASTVPVGEGQNVRCLLRGLLGWVGSGRIGLG